ncbi:nucleotidyltransferase family protein [Dyadobacter sp. CY261]|uniref:nucleotidyltransferase family protein n=1 Tax=Dyadobacter sp. CY261 TaxID=2907203 RepID=UPI001F1A7076|nr:nucleotidyltransferase family protein [Dyadobacter sp. CY261]MCF0075043.1 nucleotidyltransferase family protein [Dyadobacter sp. CY261]
MARDEYGIIILAAGNSSRLGEPKQLLQFQGKSLIRHITEAALEIAGGNVWVVTGANAGLIEQELAALPCMLIFNANWEEGMSSSIKAGISALQSHHQIVKGVILAVSDQPFASAGLFDALIETHKKNSAGIVASAYDETIGTPALFSSAYFPALHQLTGAEGAKKLFKRHSDDLFTHPFPKGNVDIDTQEDYKRLISGQ